MSRGPPGSPAKRLRYRAKQTFGVGIGSFFGANAPSLVIGSDRDCVPHHAVLIAPVSGSRLPKTGISGVFARDYYRIRSKIV
ncbi:MAG: hypothetical protein QOJ84_1578 [Bradyrhizobium sp.]|nr:hypothetical protein [Bradyrhizobium sp.]